VAECINGYSNTDFYEVMRKFNDFRVLKKQLKKKFSVGGFSAFQLLKILQKNEVTLVSTLPHYHVSKIFKMKTASTVNESLNLALKGNEKNTKISFVPHGKMTIIE
jgi:nickel-dependent lactate racemase